MIYKFEEKDADKSVEEPVNILEEVIEKEGVVVRFTIQEVKDHQAQLVKIKKELDAKRGLEDAGKQNIENNHPFVKDLSEQDLFTAHMYQEAIGMIKAIDNKLKEVNNQIEEYEKELEEIKTQLNLTDADINPEVTPEVTKEPEYVEPTE
jgi:chromosome segregation ATPase